MPVWREARDVFVQALKRRIRHIAPELARGSRHPIDELDDIQFGIMGAAARMFALWFQLQGYRKSLANWACPHCGKSVDLTEAAVLEESVPSKPEPVDLYSG